MGNTLRIGESQSCIANDRYGLGSVFLRSVPPPTIHIHLHLYSNLASENSPIPSLVTQKDSDPALDGLASPEEARAFELWLRGLWTEKEQRLTRFYEQGRFTSGEGDEGAREVIPIHQL
jgi:lysocardiolipin and lysophospholipid acyltransferase